MGPPSQLTCLPRHAPPHPSFAEQLVLHLKVAELLSSGLQTAIEQIRAGKLCLSSTVKQGECGLHGPWECSRQEAVNSGRRAA